MGRFRSGVLVALVAGIAALTVAVSASAVTPQTVTVSLAKPTEFGIVLSRKTVNKGVVVFKVTNRGTIRHDFKIAGKKTLVLGPGKAATLRVTFTKAGKYPYVCTLPGHAAGGMKGVLVVR